jgi:hypothetical protein
MNNASQRQTILNEDGELREVDVASVQTEPLFCIHCGTSNQRIASFCRKCGQPLEDHPDVPMYSGSRTKVKRAMQEAVVVQSQPMTIVTMIYNLMKLAVVGSLLTIIITTAHGEFFNYVVAALFIIGWIMVEGIQQRHG